MTIDNAHEMREKLEASIYDLIHQYEKETDTEVWSLTLERLNVSEKGGPHGTVISSVKAEVKL